MKKRLIRSRFTIAAGLVLLAGCGGGGERPAEQAETSSAVDSPEVAVDGAAAAAGTTGADETPAGASSDPFAGFELAAGETASIEPRRIALRLVNPDDGTAIVFADGGAGEVLLDSVAARSEARVDVLTRAPVVTLRSVGPSGRELRATEVTVGPDTVVAVGVGVGSRGP